MGRRKEKRTSAEQQMRKKVQGSTRSPSLCKRKLLFEHEDDDEVPHEQDRTSSSSTSPFFIYKNRAVPIVNKRETITDDISPLAQPHISPLAQPHPHPYASQKKISNGRKSYEGPFPYFTKPSSHDCADICKRLWHLHGPLEDYAKHRNARLHNNNYSQSTNYPAFSEDHLIQHMEKKIKIESRERMDDGDDELVGVDHGRRDKVSSVLDSLVATILSQSTTEANSRQAFAQLKHRFPTWEEVYKANPKELEDTIRCGGLAGRKAARILNILSILQQERGQLCLEYVRSMTTSRIKLELSRFKGVGPKTIACVLMFHLQKDEFPVDTHVFRITKMLGWVPANADREKAYLHLNDRIPNHLKFDLHCLLVTHGRRCPQCAKGGRTQQHMDGPCPLIINSTNKSI